MKRFFNKIYKGTLNDFTQILKSDLENENKKFIVTANPEAFMFGKEDGGMCKLLLDENTTIVADGIGIVKGGAKLGFDICERVPGVEIAQSLFCFGSELKKSIFLFGAKQEVIDKLKEVLAKKYPELNVLGAVNGYVKDKDAVFEEIKKLNPDIVLVALGIPQQEKLIYKHLAGFKKGIFVGVGGSFDVLSGSKERAPQFFIKHNIEWLYRIMREPKRIKRFYNSNIKFLFKIKKEK